MWRSGPDWTAEEEVASRGIDTSGVPFLVRLPREETAVICSRPFDTVVTSDLILDILRGRLISTRQLSSRLGM